MSWVGSKQMPADVYIGTRRACWSHPDEEPWAEPASGFSDAMARLNRYVDGLPKRSMWPNKRTARLWLSGGLCRAFFIDAITGLEDVSDLRRIAMAQAADRTGLSGILGLWLEASPLNTGHVCVAWEEDMLQICLGTLRRAGLRVVSARPWWTACLPVISQSATPAAISTLGLHDCDSLTLLSGDADGYTGASTLAPITDSVSAMSTWLRALATMPSGAASPLLLQLGTQPSLAQPLRWRMALGEWTREVLA